jgi:hypothetical protein
METFFAKLDGLPLPEWPKPIPTAIGAPVVPEEPRNPGAEETPAPVGRSGRGEAPPAPAAGTGRGGRR